MGIGYILRSVGALAGVGMRTSAISGAVFWACWMPFGSGCAAPGTTASAVRAPKVSATPQIRAMEHQMAQRLNRDRAAHGLAPLAYDERLADIARGHSADMRDRVFFDHHSPTTGDPQNRLDAAEYPYLTARENLAEAQDWGHAQEGLLKSPHHYENIMATDITHIGVGIVAGGVASRENLLFTQLFSHPSKVESMAAAGLAIENAILRARREKKLSALRKDSELTRLAAEKIEGLPAHATDRDMRKVGDAIQGILEKQKPLRFRGVAVAGQGLVDSSQFDVGGALLDPQARSVGVAVGKAKDQDGRSVLKVLVVVGL